MYFLNKDFERQLLKIFKIKSYSIYSYVYPFTQTYPKLTCVIKNQETDWKGVGVGILMMLVILTLFLLGVGHTFIICASYITIYYFDLKKVVFPPKITYVF